MSVVAGHRPHHPKHRNKKSPRNREKHDWQALRHRIEQERMQASMDLEHKRKKKKEPPAGAWGLVWEGEPGYDDLPDMGELPKPKPKPEPALHLVKPNEQDPDPDQDETNERSES
jgi:hypothetical protein